MSLLIFAMLRLLPGDVVDIIAGTDGTVSSASKEKLREAMGLSDPIPVQYIKWLGNLLRGDPGNSLRSGKPVGDILAHALPITIEMAVLALIISTAIAVPLGVISAVKRDTFFDFGARVGGLVGLSLPNFWVATLMLLITSKFFGWTPSIRFIPFTKDPIGNLEQMILPSIALAVPLMAITMRMTRTTMLEVLGQDYVRTAHAKGLTPRLVIVRHVLRNALMPFVTGLGGIFLLVLSGSVLFEIVFSWPGMGRLTIDAINSRDYPVMMALFVIGSFLGILGVLMVDILYSIVDPRVRYER